MTDDLQALYRDAKARAHWAEIDAEQAKRSKEIADQAAQRLIDGMVAAGVRRVARTPDGGYPVTLETRRDVKIIDADELIAALMERGAEIPYKADTLELKRIAKAVGDLPGVEQTATQYLKWAKTEDGNDGK